MIMFINTIYISIYNRHLSSNIETDISRSYIDHNKAIRDQIIIVEEYIKKYQNALIDFR